MPRRSIGWTSIRSNARFSQRASSSRSRATCSRTRPTIARRWCSRPALAERRIKRSSSSASRTEPAHVHAIARSVLLGLALPSAAAAHHSFFGRFNTLTLVELEGEVTEVLWRNPHAYFSVRADGVLWEIETRSLTVLERMGIDQGTIQIGRAHV